MQYTHIFPTSIGSDYRPDLAELALPIAKDYLKQYGRSHMSDNHVTTYYNDPICHEVFAKDERLKPIYDYVIQQSKIYLIAQNLDISKYNLKTPPWTFFASVGKGSEHPAHTHPESLFSCILYLSTTDNCPPIVFNDPRQYYKYTVYHNLMGRPNNSYTLFQEYSIIPKTGMFLIWPAWLEHQVPMSMTDDERITMVFNINKV